MACTVPSVKLGLGWAAAEAAGLAEAEAAAEAGADAAALAGLAAAELAGGAAPPPQAASSRVKVATAAKARIASLLHPNEIACSIKQPHVRSQLRRIRPVYDVSHSCRLWRPSPSLSHYNGRGTD